VPRGRGEAPPSGTSSVHEDLELRILTERLRLLRSQRELAALHCQSFTDMLEAALTQHPDAKRGTHSPPHSSAPDAERGAHYQAPAPAPAAAAAEPAPAPAAAAPAAAAAPVLPAGGGGRAHLPVRLRRAPGSALAAPPVRGEQRPM